MSSLQTLAFRLQIKAEAELTGWTVGPSRRQAPSERTAATPRTDRRRSVARLNFVPEGSKHTWNLEL